MEIKVTRITEKSLADLACSFTSNKEVRVNSMYRLYQAGHSPIRTQMFMIEMYGIPTFVSTHLVRHKIGIEHWVQSNRPDRGGNGKAYRTTPINHLMMANAEALINMSHRRLCSKASPETREVMQKIKEEIGKIDSDLFECMIPTCLFRGGQCFEFGGCGMCPRAIGGKL